MKKRIILIIGLGIGLMFLSLILSFQRNRIFENFPKEMPWWEIQSIDTVKYSRDIARVKANDPNFDQEIEKQISLIAGTGATHVAIGTPYDAEFLPFLKRWISVARRNNLKIWFRGNFSGWEGWFGYKAISRDEHLKLLEKFILSNGDLFENGDIFSPCPECENGGPGDPRTTGDLDGHKEFLINEYKISNEMFRKIGKNIRTNFPMNGDVARAIMDKRTTQALGGYVVIDHYVKDPDQLSKDVSEIAVSSGGKIILGEFGVPLPDLQGNLTPEEQALWIENALKKLSTISDFIGINYWVSFGGSTNLWETNYNPRLAVEVIKKYFNPRVLSGKIIDETGESVQLAKITINGKDVYSDINGFFTIPYIIDKPMLKIETMGYVDELIDPVDNPDKTIVLKRKNPNIFYRFYKFLHLFTSKVAIKIL